MATKIKVHVPKDAHRLECRVVYADTDSGGVVYYGNYLRYFEMGRTEYLREYGFTYRDLEEQGYVMPVIECYTRYKASACYDDLIVIQTAVSDVKKVSCRFSYRIEKKENKQLLALGFTVNAIVDRTGRLTNFPDPVFQKLNKLALTCSSEGVF